MQFTWDRLLSPHYSPFFALVKHSASQEFSTSLGRRVVASGESAISSSSLEAHKDCVRRGVTGERAQVSLMCVELLKVLPHAVLVPNIQSIDRRCLSAACTCLNKYVRPCVMRMTSSTRECFSSSCCTVLSLLNKSSLWRVVISSCLEEVLQQLAQAKYFFGIKHCGVKIYT